MVNYSKTIISLYLSILCIGVSNTIVASAPTPLSKVTLDSIFGNQGQPTRDRLNGSEFAAKKNLKNDELFPDINAWCRNAQTISKLFKKAYEEVEQGITDGSDPLEADVRDQFKKEIEDFIDDKIPGIKNSHAAKNQLINGFFIEEFNRTSYDVHVKKLDPVRNYTTIIMTPESKTSLETVFGKLGTNDRKVLHRSGFDVNGDLSDINSWCRDPKTMNIEQAYKNAESKITDGSKPTKDAVKTEFSTMVDDLISNEFPKLTKVGLKNLLRSDIFLDEFDIKAYDDYIASLNSPAPKPPKKDDKAPVETIADPVKPKSHRNKVLFVVAVGCVGVGYWLKTRNSTASIDTAAAA